MPTIYVNDLNGYHLDFWVAQAEGLDAICRDNRCLLKQSSTSEEKATDRCYAPSLDPDISGPLIAKYAVDIFQSGDRWAAELKHRESPWGSGTSRVEAALRAIVAARFGDVVNDPEITLPQHCFWLAFIANGIRPDRYLGHAIIDAQDMDAALAIARRQAMHPGSDTRVYRVNDDDASLIAQHLRNRLLSAEEAAQLGWSETRQ